jgi:hypothetical protein
MSGSQQYSYLCDFVTLLYMQEYLVKDEKDTFLIFYPHL